MTKSKWFGDEKDGIEVRWQGDDIDEVLVYVDGRVVMHAERMSDTYFWIGLYALRHTVHINLGSVNNRSHVEFGEPEGWEE